MTAPIKVTDLVTLSLSELDKSQNANPLAAESHDAKAAIYSRLAQAQSMKTANVIAYLNSDRSRWSKTDEAVVRVMLGLHATDTDDGGDQASTDPQPDPAPVQDPAPEPTPDPPMFDDEMPDFAEPFPTYVGARGGKEEDDFA